MGWSNPDANLENQLKELINKRKSNESEFKIALNYEYFLWDFNNWKNYFLNNDEK